eukprot:TRINITY_DN64868_c0_g1_i1.p2 TRINITY_DN64868_c0_g1~~TRINITY_DN64868_c0_g1_i1.p2  ORF type:complete len:117 (+),score=27.53 TRINITY_DN64868_c0_g1_i1:91-441(+)
MFAARKFALLVVAGAACALMLQGCGGDCTRENVVACSGEQPEVCKDSNPANDGDQCCKYLMKVAKCHEEQECPCDQQRAEGDGQDTIKKYLDYLRQVGQICQIVGIKPSEWTQHCA